jgi:hypothetical protein
MDRKVSLGSRIIRFFLIHLWKISTTNFLLLSLIDKIIKRYYYYCYLLLSLTTEFCLQLFVNLLLIE